MNHKISILFLLYLTLTSCEVQRSEDSEFLHPFPGPELGVLSFIDTRTGIFFCDVVETVEVNSERISGTLTGWRPFLRTITNSPINFDSTNPPYVFTIQNIDMMQNGFTLSIDHPKYGLATSSTLYPLDPHQFTEVIDTISNSDSTVTIRPSITINNTNLGYSTKIVRFANGNPLGDNLELAQLPFKSMVQPIYNGIKKIDPVVLKPTFTIFENFRPVDTVVVDSMHVVIYTWGEEGVKYIESLRDTNRDFGDGDETIENTTYTNWDNAYGVSTAFVTDTLKIRLSE